MSNQHHLISSPPHLTRPSELLPPLVRARTDWVTVLVSGSWHEWYDHWITHSINGAVENNHLIKRLCHMFTPAAIGLAATALRQHFDTHRARYTAANVTLFVEPVMDAREETICTFGLLKNHNNALHISAFEDPTFLEIVKDYARLVATCREGDEPFPVNVYAPGDGFFSAVDQSTTTTSATLINIATHPEQYALVDVQITTLYGRIARVRREDGADMISTA